jgi:hypothetical protein
MTQSAHPVKGVGVVVFGIHIVILMQAAAQLNVNSIVSSVRESSVGVKRKVNGKEMSMDEKLHEKPPIHIPNVIHDFSCSL